MVVDFTDDTNTPELQEGGKAVRGAVYINHTKGLWVRKNRAMDALEIWYDGEYQAAWATADAIEARLQTLMRYAFEMGERKGKKDNQDALRKALGLDK